MLKYPTQQAAYQHAYAYLKPMGIELWVERTSEATEKTQKPSAVKASYTEPLSTKLSFTEPPSKELSSKEPSFTELSPIQPLAQSGNTLNQADAARYAPRAEDHKVQNNNAAQTPSLLGIQNIAFIQTPEALVIALNGKHMDLQAPYLALIMRMLERCGVNISSVEHSVLDSMHLHHRLHFHDEDIIQALLSHMHQRQEKQPYAWVILLGSALAPLQAQWQNANTSTLLIEQEVVDLLSFPETRKQAWEALLPLRSRKVPDIS